MRILPSTLPRVSYAVCYTYSKELYMKNREEFFLLANERAKVRIFEERDYNAYCEAYQKAEKAAINGQPYYADANAGGVANSYGYRTSSARWGVWVTNDKEVEDKVDRYSICSSWVSHSYPWGERKYFSDFRKGKVHTCPFTQHI